MYDTENFEEIFEGRNYSEGLVSDILENQSKLGGKTFFERLLELLKIRWNALYPPKSPSELRELHNRIISAPITLHYKHCLIFYLLKDLSPSTHTSPRLADRFADDIHLEKRFRIFIEGIWDLDHLMWESGVESLLWPGIAGMTFADEILAGLLRRAGIVDGRSGAVGGAKDPGAKDPLPLAYFLCAACPLEDQKVRMLFAKYLAARNVTEMWSWIRERPEHEHRLLFETLLESALSPSHCSASREQAKRDAGDRAMELVSLPLSPEEEEWLERFLTEGKGRLLAGAEDTVTMRMIATGRLSEVGKEGGVKGRRLEGVSWEGIRVGVRSGLGGREEGGGFGV